MTAVRRNFGVKSREERAYRVRGGARGQLILIDIEQAMCRITEGCSVVNVLCEEFLTEHRLNCHPIIYTMAFS